MYIYFILLTKNLLTIKKEKRINEARKSFRKMQKEIAPFIKHRKVKQYSTAGEWRETSNYNF